MCEYAVVGRKWGLVKKFDHVFLDFKGKEHYLVELREKEWDYAPNPMRVEGMRVYYEWENKLALLKKLKQIGVKDPEDRVEIISKVKRIVERRFGTK